jgi:flagellar biosynthesis/type III secretory pathway protein FliH
VPWVRDVRAARAAPELATLSAVAHGGEPGGLAVAAAAVQATAGLDAERATLYNDFILSGLPEAVRRALEEQMGLRHSEYQSELVRKWVLKGRKEGREEGREEGRKEGESLGVARGKAEAVLAVLAARGLAVKKAERSRILACTDLEVLDRWVIRATTAASVAELLD